MPRARNPNRDKAYQIFEEYHGNIENRRIAEMLDEDERVIAVWKGRDKWAEKLKKNNVVQQSTESCTTKKRGSKRTSNVAKKKPPKDEKRRPDADTKSKGSGGAPLGNKNAVGSRGGNGGPHGNKYALKHGGYSAVYWDSLDEKERQMIEETPTDEEEVLVNQIRLFDVRERRLMTAISKYKDIKGGLAVSGVRSFYTKREFDNDAEKERYAKLKQTKIDEDKISYLGYDKSTSTDTEATINVVQRLEKELSSVQRAKTQCVTELSKIRQSKEGAKGNSLAEDWIMALTGGDVEDE